jgi:hypothetical protein
MTLGLGNEYPISDYATQFYWNRTSTGGNPYVSVRFREGGTWGGWAKIYAGYADTAGSADYNGLSNKGGGTGTYTTSGDYRAPIFYDSNDTAYYVDPTGTSTLQVIQSNGQDVAYSARRDISGGTWSARIVSRNFTTNVAAFLANYNGSAGLFGHSAALDAWSPVYINNLGGTSQANVWLGNMYAPIFYDSNDSAFYLDPSTTGIALATNGILSSGTGTNGGVQNRTYTSGRNRIWSFGNADGYGLSYFQGGPDYIGLHVSGSPTQGGSDFWVSSQGISQTSGSSRAPIFYDSNDTGYYIDPHSTSNTALRMRGGALFGPNVTWGAYLAVGGNGNIDTAYASVATTNGNLHMDASSGSSMYLNYYAGSNVYFGNGGAGGIFAQIASDGSFRSPVYYDYNNTGYYLNMDGGSNMATTLTGYIYFASNRNTSSDSPPLQAFSNNGSGAIMSFHRGGYYAVNFGLDSDNVIRIGGWSASANRLQMDMSGNLTMAGNVTAYSDERLKKDWEDLPNNFIESLAELKIGTYTRIDSEERQVGASAQGLQKFLKEAVQTDADGMLSVNYGGAALASAAELAKYVTALEKRIQQLEARI